MNHQGTWATYQGVPCISVRFRRTRGIAADLSQVVVPAQPVSNLTWPEPPAGAFDRRVVPEALPAGLAAALQGNPKPLALPAGFQWEGDLVLAEDGTQPLVVPGMVIVRVEREDPTATGSPEFLRLTLADQRLFWGMGALGKWRFNVLRKDGTVSKDTLKPDGKRYSLADTAREVVGDMWRAPRLNRVPADWATDVRDVEFGAYARASESLEALAVAGNAAGPCYHLDGEVGIYHHGEGMVGWAPEGKGENREQFPADQVTARGFSWDAQFPSPWLLVVGGPRVATVALDDWEPVVMVRGTPHLLSEELVRELTGGKHGLVWLAKLLFVASAGQAADGVDDEVVQLLMRQAWRYYRLPGAEKHLEGRYTGEPGHNAHLLPLLPRAETAAGQRLPVTVQTYSHETRRKRYQGTTEGGKLIAAKRKLAEIRAAAKTRAAQQGQTSALETDGRTVRRGAGGNRLTTIRGLSLRDMLGRVAADDGAAQRIRDDFASSDGVLSGLTDPLDFLQGVAEGFTDEVTRGVRIVGGEVPPALRGEKVEQYMRELRRVEQLKEQGQSTEAERYRAALAERVAAESSLGDGTAALAFELAQKLTGYERDAANGAGTPAAFREAFVRQFGSLVRQEVERSANRMQQAREASRTAQETGTAGGQITTAVYLHNKRRSDDGGARVVDADLGVVRTSGLAGHVLDENVASASRTQFVPKPVRVLFGAKLAPRVDKPPTQAQLATRTGTRSAAGTVDREARAATARQERQAAAEQLVADTKAATQRLVASLLAVMGSAPIVEGGDHVIPAALGERESVYTSAWYRSARGKVEPALLDAVPLAQATVVRRPRWQELVPLPARPGEPATVSNKAQLDAEARKLALALANRPDRVREASLEVAGPWPVQCDGVVAGVEIVMHQVGGAPCGFTTTVATGGDSTLPREVTAERGA